MIYKNYLFLFIVIFIGIVPLHDLLHSGLPLTHDGQDHLARIANFYQNLSEGTIVPRWAGNLNWGYGHPVLMFLYPLPSYAASFFHALGFTFIDSLKIIFGIAFILSGVTMYIWVRSFLGELAGLISGILYMFAPYRFVDLYVRGAIGEHVAFVFPPLVLFFLLRLSRKISYWNVVFGALSFAGFILAHNAISLMFFPLIILYAFYLFARKKEKMEYLFSVGLVIFFGFCLAGFFWIPAFFEGKYTLRDIVTGGEYALRFVDVKDFIYGEWSYGGTGQFSVQLGIVQWIMLIVAIPITMVLRKKKSEYWIVCLAAILLIVAFLFLMTSQAQFIWEIITTLQKFQFPWRFLSVVVFLTAVVGAFVVYSAPKKFQAAGVIAIIVFTLFFNKDYWHAKDYFHRQDSFYENIYDGTTDTGESAPIWSVRFMEKRPEKSLEVLSGGAEIVQGYRASTLHEYDLTVLEKTRLKENTLYFPGWHVFIDNVEVPVQFQDPAHRGLLTFFVEKGEHNISVVFKETKLRLLGDAITASAFLLLVGLYIIRRKIWSRFR